MGRIVGLNLNCVLVKKITLLIITGREDVGKVEGQLPSIPKDLSFPSLSLQAAGTFLGRLLKHLSYSHAQFTDVTICV